jgi:Undecaprenyl-phosphate galactose phosphotransferase WbaP
MMLLVSDLAAVFLSFFLSFGLRKYGPLPSPLVHEFDVYLNVGLALLLWPLMFSQQGLYPGYWLTSREELRRIAIGSTVASLLAMALTFITRTGLLYSRPILIGGWFLSLFIAPAFRFITRRLAARIGLSGPPAVILGADQAAATVIGMLREQSPPALRPVALFAEEASRPGAAVAGVPVVGTLEQAPEWAVSHRIGIAIVAVSGTPSTSRMPSLESQATAFSRMIVISDLYGVSGADVIAHDMQGVLALELRRNLLSRNSLYAKRVMDLVLLCLSLVVTLPLAAVISLAILVESGQPVIFGHLRIGKDGKPFTAWKFRSMIGGADQALTKAVDNLPELREEWNSRQKLRMDPRLTRVGRALRRTSMDELPQLWNVLLGQMSLVGPRPIVADEIPRYGEAIRLYTQVPPGLTGLWQVSGRSDTTYAERVRLDTHYVRSWSIWMDIVILVRTVWIVLAGTGAY